METPGSRPWARPAWGDLAVGGKGAVAIFTSLSIEYRLAESAMQGPDGAALERRRANRRTINGNGLARPCAVFGRHSRLIDVSDGAGSLPPAKFGIVDGNRRYAPRVSPPVVVARTGPNGLLVPALPLR